MELIIAFVVIIAIFGLLDLAAMRWGVNSRHTNSDWMPLTDNDLMESNGHI